MFKEKIINALENLKRVYKTDRKIWCKIYWYDRFYFRDSFNDHDKRQNMVIILNYIQCLVKQQNIISYLDT
jgi:hypothetical protein